MKASIWLSATTMSFAAVIAVVGMYAIFSDTATSTNNLFSASAIDLLINEQDSIGGFIGGGNLKPGDVVNGSVTLKNNGTMGGDLVDLDIALSIDEGSGYQVTGLSKYLRIRNLTYGALNIAIDDVNQNGFPDLNDWDQRNTNTTDLSDPGSGTVLSLTVEFDRSAPNDTSGASSTVKFTFFLAQVAADDLPP